MSITLTWHGHATWAISTPKYKIVVDPFFDQNPSAVRKANEIDAQFLLITHGHFDHIADAAPIAQRNGAQVIANYEIAQWLATKGVEQTVGMNIGGSVSLDFGSVKMTPAWHSSTLPDGAAGGTPGGFVIKIEDQTIYFAGDTALFGDMTLIGKAKIDVAILPIGDLFTMGIDDSIEAIKMIQPRFVLPSHFGTWPPIAQDAQAWAQRVKQETVAEPIVPQVAQPWTLEPVA